MSRGDDNKRGRSSGESSRSNQPFPGKKKHSKSNHNKRQRGGSPSNPQQLQFDSEADRNRGGKPEQESRSHHSDEKNFNILVDNLPYLVTATRFKFNGEVRYKVSFNGSSEHVFTWDSSLGQLRAIDDEASTMPDNLEMAISEKLQARV